MDITVMVGLGGGERSDLPVLQGEQQLGTP
jgi:hypothetical protein